eukprot:Nk52_evm5s1869 gene=Nk52_evmTU5s1869
MNNPLSLFQSRKGGKPTSPPSSSSSSTGTVDQLQIEEIKKKIIRVSHHHSTTVAMEGVGGGDSNSFKKKKKQKDSAPANGICESLATKISYNEYCTVLDVDPSTAGRFVQDMFGWLKKLSATPEQPGNVAVDVEKGEGVEDDVKNGFIDPASLFQAMYMLSKCSTFEDKVGFLFDMWSDEESEHITREKISQLMKSSMEESKLELADNNMLDTMLTLLFRSSSKGDALNFEEFYRLMRKHEKYLNISTMIGPTALKLSSYDPTSTCLLGMQDIPKKELPLTPKLSRKTSVDSRKLEKRLNSSEIQLAKELKNQHSLEKMYGVSKARDMSPSTLRRSMTMQGTSSLIEAEPVKEEPRSDDSGIDLSSLASSGSLNGLAIPLFGSQSGMRSSSPLAPRKEASACRSNPHIVHCSESVPDIAKMGNGEASSFADGRGLRENKKQGPIHASVNALSVEANQIPKPESQDSCDMEPECLHRRARNDSPFPYSTVNKQCSVPLYSNHNGVLSSSPLASRKESAKEQASHLSGNASLVVEKQVLALGGTYGYHKISGGGSTEDFSTTQTGKESGERKPIHSDGKCFSEVKLKQGVDSDGEKSAEESRKDRHDICSLLSLDFEELDDPRFSTNLRTMLANNSASIAFFSVLIGLIIFFITLYLEKFPLLNEWSGGSVSTAKVSAGVINFCTMCLLLLPCKRFMTALRDTSLSLYCNFDSNVKFHKYISYIMLTFSLIHVGSHYHNFYLISKTPYQSINSLLQQDTGDPNVTIFHEDKSLKWLMFQSLPGATGHALLFVMILIFVPAIYRRSNFNLFFYTHYFYLAFLGLLIAHGQKHWLQPPSTQYYLIFPMVILAWEMVSKLRTLVQSTSVISSKIHENSILELEIAKPTTPKFESKPGQYIYINVPEISKYEWHPFTLTSCPEEPNLRVHVKPVGDWTNELVERMKANHEDAPQRGSSTDSDSDEANTGSSSARSSPAPFPIINVHGPYGAPSQEVEKYSNVVLIGTGIGITPLAGIVQSYFSRRDKEVNEDEGGEEQQQKQHQIKAKKIKCICLTRDQKEISWFKDIYEGLKRHQESENLDSLLDQVEILHYITGAYPDNDIRSLLLRIGIEEVRHAAGTLIPDKEERKKERREMEKDSHCYRQLSFSSSSSFGQVCPVSGTNFHTHFGRPAFMPVFKDLIKDAYLRQKKREEKGEECVDEDGDERRSSGGGGGGRESIGVFFCGNSKLGRNLRNMLDYLNKSQTLVTFEFRKEIF